MNGKNHTLSVPQDLYQHEPGHPAQSGVLDLGLRCVHSCRFCYYSFFGGAAGQFEPLRKAAFRSTADSLEIVRLFAQQGFKRFDVTGGEPTLHEGLTEMVRRASLLGLSPRVITLGQFLGKAVKGSGTDLLSGLLDAGVADFLFSLHAPDKALFKDFTGASFERLLAAMTRLDRQGVQYGANTVVFTGSTPRLEEIARVGADHGVFQHNFILFNAYHAWSGSARAAGVQESYRAIEPRLVRAVEHLVAQDIAVNVRYAPLCAFPQLRRHVVGFLGQQFDPYEWRNRACNPEREPQFCAQALELPPQGVRPVHAFAQADETLPNGVKITGKRGQDLTVFAGPCRECAALGACDGLNRGYLELYGDAELQPFAAAQLHGPLLQERLEYKAAFAVKLGLHADMRSYIRALRARQ